MHNAPSCILMWIFHNKWNNTNFILVWVINYMFILIFAAISKSLPCSSLSLFRCSLWKTTADFGSPYVYFITYGLICLPVSWKTDITMFCLVLFYLWSPYCSHSIFRRKVKMLVVNCGRQLLRWSPLIPASSYSCPFGITSSWARARLSNLLLIKQHCKNVLSLTRLCYKIVWLCRELSLTLSLITE